jgi:hypothetical protein
MMNDLQRGEQKKTRKTIEEGFVLGKEQVMTQLHLSLYADQQKRDNLS